VVAVNLLSWDDELLVLFVQQLPQLFALRFALKHCNSKLKQIKTFNVFVKFISGMKTGVILNLSLALHLVGLSMSIGIALTKYLSFRKSFFGNEFDQQKWALTLSNAKTLSRSLGFGMGLAILSGALMMHLAYSNFMNQIWFQLKIALLLLIIVTGLLLGRSESKLRNLLKEEMNLDAVVLSSASRIKLFAGIQLVLFIMIIFLASFRFN
jgi:hypothetical protein